MTKAEVVAKAEELSASMGVKVHPITFLNGSEDDIVYGFLKEPSFLVKARAMDKIYSGMGFTANLEILEACIIKEHTDPRMLSEVAPMDRFKLGAAKYVGELLLISTDQTEKKN